MFQFFEPRRKRGEPPRRFTPSDTLHMTEREWEDYFAQTSDYLHEVSNAFELWTWTRMVHSIRAGRFGGAQDGQQSVQ